VARAKRTDRAAARRRYRAAMGEPIEDAETSDVISASRSEPPPTRAGTGASAGGAPERPSIVGAFRTAFLPVDLRGDLRSLPQLLLTRAFLIPTVLSGLAFIAFALNPSSLTAIFYQYFSYQFPVAGVFIAGFFAPKASWLIGALVSIVSAAFQFPLLVGQSPELVLAIVVQGALYGAFFAAAAAWYRRFLNRANPNRSRPGQGGRRPDGKVARRPQQRPMLARRR
jgi:hypothetical protein